MYKQLASSAPDLPQHIRQPSSFFPMENTTEEDLSSMANHPFSGSGDECSAASEESGWTTYIDYFMETQQQYKETSSACTSPSTNDTGRSTSENTGDHGVRSGAIASFAEAPRLPALVDPSEVSSRLSFRKKEGIRRKKLLHDESLEDTATSPISSPKLIDSRDSDDKHKKKQNACDKISHIAKNTTDELDRDNHIINDNGANTSTDMISDDMHMTTMS